ncbi:MAG: lantibiotic dehydratase [Candidatus Eisenbacteria bacterium]
MTELSPHILVRVACAPFESLEAFTPPEVMAAIDRLDGAEAAEARARSALEEALFRLAGPSAAEAGASRTRFAVLALRRDIHSGRATPLSRLAAYVASGDLGADLVQSWGERVAERDRALEAATATLAAADHCARQAILARLAADPLLREGLRLVGRSLAGRAARLLWREPAAWRAADRQAAATVLEYITRMATKTSPNGVFCTTALGAWGESARAAGSALPVRVLARLNIAEARRLAAPLLGDPVFARAPLGLNPALRREDDAWSWWRGASAEDSAALEQRARVRATPLLAALVAHLEEVPSGTVDRAGLVAWAGEKAGPDAEAWIDRLRTAGLLIDSRGIPHLEPRPLRWLAAAARAASAPNSAPAWVDGVEHIESCVDAIDRASDSAGRIHAGDGVLTAAAALSAGHHGDEDALVRIDSAASLAVTLPLRVGEEIRRVLPRYARLFAALYPPSVRLAPYRSRFLARYPADRDVGLAELFHGVFDELGGFTRSSYPDPARMVTGELDDEACQAVAAHERFRRFFAERSRCAEDLELADADWEHLAGPAPPAPFSCGLLFQLVPGAGGERLVWNGIYGPGLAVSRLAELHPALGGVAAEGWKSVAPPGSVLAEIPYGHAGRTANAGLRPGVFPDEIALPGETPTPGARTFPLSDLSVRYESASRRFRVRSRRHGVDIAPVLTSGLSPEGFVSFLVAVGQQDTPPLALFPDVDDRRLGSLPRIVSGRTVLFRRRWSVAPDEARAMLLGGDRPDRLRRFRRWTRDQALPARVFASTVGSAKPRFVHLESSAFFHVLEELAAEGTALVLREMLPAPENAWFHEGEKSHAIEFLVHARGSGEWSE